MVVISTHLSNLSTHINIHLKPNHWRTKNTKQQKDDVKDFVFIVEFNIKPESRDALLKSLTTLVEAMAKETFVSTYLPTYLHQDTQDENKFLIYERGSKPSMEAFMEKQLRGKSYRDEYEGRLPEWSSEPRKIAVLTLWANG